jgi:hypothetical protein
VTEAAPPVDAEAELQKPNAETGARTRDPSSATDELRSSFVYRSTNGV